MKKNLALLILALSLISCGGGGSDDDGSASGGQFSGSCSLRITNGSQCATGAGPIVLVELVDSADNIIATCTGAFITAQHVLTGAHCFDFGTRRAVIRFSDQQIASSGIAIPPDYESTVSTISPVDFAVVTLQQPAVGVETLPFLVSKTTVIGDELNVIGYGQDENGNSALAGNSFEDALKKGTMVVVDKDQGLRAFAAEFNSTGQSVCSGDSGGPAIMLNDDGIAGIVGITQAVTDTTGTGEPVCLEDTIAVFTDMQNQSNLGFVQVVTGGVGQI